MPYALDLNSSWAKWERAKTHVDQLRREIEQAGKPDPRRIDLIRNYDRRERAVICRIKRVIKIRDHWPLVLGDAVHDLRGALDHLAWQLAVRALDGSVPTDKQAKTIQFPVAEKSEHWGKRNNRFLTYMLQDDIDRLEPFQPFKTRAQGLPALIAASNTDKHRAIHVVLNVTQGVFFQNPSNLYRDCKPRVGLDRAGNKTTMVVTFQPVPSRNNEVIRYFVEPTGPHPDVETQNHLTGFIAFGDNRWDLLTFLTESVTGVGAILKEF